MQSYNARCFCTKLRAKHTPKPGTPIKPKRWSNVAASKQLKALYTAQRSEDARETDANALLQRAFAIYDGVDGATRNHFVVNSMLKLCLTLRRSEEALCSTSVWRDVLRVDDVSASLALRCCVDAASRDRASATAKALQLLRRTIQSTADLSACRGAIAELLRQSDATQLRALSVVLRECDDVFIRTALIRALGNCGDAELKATAPVLFDAIPLAERDAVAVHVAMKALMSGGRHGDALALFRSHAALTSDSATAHRLALRACFESARFDEALAMFDALAQLELDGVDSASIVRALQSCAKLGALAKARDQH